MLFERIGSKKRFRTELSTDRIKRFYGIHIIVSDADVGRLQVWLPYLNKHVDELWVPSEFNRNSYVANGLSADKIQVIAHGIFVEKFKREPGVVASVSDSPLRSLKKRSRKNFKVI